MQSERCETATDYLPFVMFIFLAVNGMSSFNAVARVDLHESAWPLILGSKHTTGKKCECHASSRLYKAFFSRVLF